MARSEVNYLYDDDTAFRAPGSAAVTATASFTELALDKMTNAREGEQKDKLGAEKYAVVIAVSAIDVADADETYTFDVEIGPTGLASGTVDVATMAIDATGQYVMEVDAHTVENLVADPSAIRLNVTIAGTTPSITFSAWLA